MTETSPARALHAFWIEFDWSRSEGPSVIGIVLADRVLHLLDGVGVTAFDVEDALELVHAYANVAVLPELRRVTRDPDISTLGVRGEMHSPVTRGVWFPVLRT